MPNQKELALVVIANALWEDIRQRCHDEEELYRFCLYLYEFSKREDQSWMYGNLQLLARDKWLVDMLFYHREEELPVWDIMKDLYSNELVDA